MDQSGTETTDLSNLNPNENPEEIKNEPLNSNQNNGEVNKEAEPLLQVKKPGIPLNFDYLKV